MLPPERHQSKQVWDKTQAQSLSRETDEAATDNVAPFKMPSAAVPAQYVFHVLPKRAQRISRV
jgi:hypothetical protein